MKPEIFSEHVLYWLGPVPVTATMATSVATSVLPHPHGSWKSINARAVPDAKALRGKACQAAKRAEIPGISAAVTCRIRA